MIKKGDRVKVDFISKSRTIYSGKRFTGYGVVDRFEDNRVYGRLDDGRPFMCFAADVELFKTKYDWSNVPKEVKWIATDSDGEVWGFQCRPHTLENYMWTGFMPIGLGTIGATGYWQESLEQRPEEQSQ